MYGQCLILEVELRAILDEIILARGHNFLDFWVKLDSIAAIHYITKGEGP